MSDVDKAMANRWNEELWNNADFSSANDFVSEMVSFESNHIPSTQGITQLEQAVLGLHTGAPDGRYAVIEMIAEGDTVVARWKFHGTHSGDIFGIPKTGKTVDFTGTGTTHFKNGKIVDYTSDWDALTMMQQSGAVKS